MLIDGVFSGGGMKAIAYAGAIQALEEKNLTFKRLAGTSAGSIVAALLAANYKSDEIMEVLNLINPADFLEEKSFFNKLPVVKWIRLYFRYGLYRGDAFEGWIATLLKNKGIETFGDLDDQRLRIVVSDISTGKMVIFPDDLPDYGIDPDTFRIAKAVRISCSLPFFFEPDTILNKKGEKCLMVDGGVLSNFPIWLFDGSSSRPIRPFIGLQLSSKRMVLTPKKINNVLDYFHRVFLTMKEGHDEVYISKYAATNIIFIPVHGVSTAEFNLSEAQKKALIVMGYKKTIKFLKTWSY